MIYKVIVEHSELCGCENEGDLIILLNGNRMRVYFQADKEFYNDYILAAKNNELDIDLWIVYGKPRKIDVCEKKLPIGIKIAGGNLRGEVISIMSNNELKLDCGLKVDVDSEVELVDIINVGDFIEISGTYQVFFPGSKYERDY